MKRATIKRNNNSCVRVYFNPRPREEGDPCHIFRAYCPMKISIHALVKRATGWNNQMLTSITDFNPRPREEGDMRIYAVAKGIFYFNPRPREEGD